MSENEILLRAYVDAFNRHDPEALLATLAEDVVHDINEGPTEIGKKAFRRFKDHMDECFREQLNEVVVMTAGNRGAIEFRCDGEYIGTDGDLPPAHGQPYSIRAAAFFEVKDGRISRVTSYYNLLNWLAAIRH